MSTTLGLHSERWWLKSAARRRQSDSKDNLCLDFENLPYGIAEPLLSSSLLSLLLCLLLFFAVAMLTGEAGAVSSLPRVAGVCALERDARDMN